MQDSLSCSPNTCPIPICISESNSMMNNVVPPCQKNASAGASSSLLSFSLIPKAWRDQRENGLSLSSKSQGNQRENGEEVIALGKVLCWGKKNQLESTQSKFTHESFRLSKLKVEKNKVQLQLPPVFQSNKPRMFVSFFKSNLAATLILSNLSHHSGRIDLHRKIRWV